MTDIKGNLEKVRSTLKEGVLLVAVTKTHPYQDINTAKHKTKQTKKKQNLNKDYEHLYKLISDGFIDMPANEISLELPNDIIGLKFAKNYGQTTMQFVHYINKSNKYIGKTQFLTKKQVDKIFGKKSTGNYLQSTTKTPAKTVKKSQ